MQVEVARKVEKALQVEVTSDILWELPGNMAYIGRCYHDTGFRDEQPVLAQRQPAFGGLPRWEYHRSSSWPTTGLAATLSGAMGLAS